jgi:hypothetical protein
MYDTDTAHHFIDADLTPRFQLLAPLFPILDDLSDLADDALTDPTNSLEPGHFVPYCWFSGLEIRTNGLKLRRLRGEVR